MSKSSSSTSPSTPLPQLVHRPTTARRQSSARIRHPSIIPLDYNYRTMTPASSLSQQHSSTQEQNTAAGGVYYARRLQMVTERSTSVDTNNEIDYQYSSLFGDPVPPAPSTTTDFISSQFDSPPLLHRTSAEGSSEEDAFGQTYTRLFPDPSYANTANELQRHYSTTPRNFNALPMPMPRLQPPDIQILPNSSGGSSSEARDSPNFALLAPEDIMRRPAVYDMSEPGDVNELIETVTISDGSGAREYTEATRRVSNFAEDFKSNVGAISSFHPVNDTPTPTPSLTKSSYGRQYSEDSYSSADWLHPLGRDVPEIRMPRLRPSSKNIMSMKCDQMPPSDSPVAAMINDSNGSSSGEERLLNTTHVLEHPSVSLEALKPTRPPNPSPTRMRELELDLLRSRSSTPSLPPEYLKQRRKSSTGSMESNFMTPPPPPQPPPPHDDTPAARIQTEEREEVESENTIRGNISPVILRDLVTTGSEYRVDEPIRLHKKSSFTIISDRSPQSSRAQSPTPNPQKKTASPQRHRDSTSSSSPTKPVAKPRQYLQRKSLTSLHLKLPPLSHQQRSDDSQRPSVQFNMSGGRYTPSRMPQKGILHNRDSLTSSQDTLPHTSPTPPPNYGQQRGKSYEALPLITDPYRTAIPRLYRSHTDLSPEPTVIPPGALPRPLKPNPNPTRKQKGLLRIMPSGNVVTRIPLRSNWVSMEDLAAAGRRRSSLAPLLGAPMDRRRSSSTSPERRSSTQTASDRRSSNLSTVTTSDFSFRRPSTSVAPLAQRRKSIMPSTTAHAAKRRQSLLPAMAGAARGGSPSSLLGNRTPRAKVAKPSPLSPIIGTPNKDSSTPQSPVIRRRGSMAPPSETASDTTSRRNSVSSKIPVRSADTSRQSTQADSRLHSRSNSPLKEFTAQLPLSSGFTSRATSSRSPSLANSRVPSRSTSRASTRPLSRGPPSRSSSRPNSRIDQANELQVHSRSNSRTKSRMPVQMELRAGSVSPNIGRKQGNEHILSRRQSISLSPRAMRRKRGHAPSISPAKGGRSKTPAPQSGRQSARSRIPTRADSVLTGGRSSPTKASSTSPEKNRELKRTSPTRKSTSETQRKQTVSAKKRPTSVSKPDSSAKRTPSSVSKQAAATKKQPSNLQKSNSNLKRETSNVQPRSSTAGGMKPVRREVSTLSMKKTNGGTATGAKKPLPGKATGKPAAGKTAGKAKAGPGSRPSTNPAIVADAEKASTSSGAETSGGMKRAASSIALMRMGSKISMLSKKRSDSNLGSLATQPLAEETSNGKTKDANAQMAAALTTQLNKLTTGSSTGDDAQTQPAAASIIEKSQKTLETIQKTVTEATDEIHKTINENLTDLKSMEQDMGKVSDSAASPTSSVATVVEKKSTSGKPGESVSRAGTADGAKGDKKPSAPLASNHAEQKSPLPPTQPIEAAVSVVTAAAAQIDATATQAATAVAQPTATEAERNHELDVKGKIAAETSNASTNANNAMAIGGGANSVSSSVAHSDVVTAGAGSAEDFKTEANRRSPEGHGGSTADSGEKGDSQEFLTKAEEDEAGQPRGCCSCCSRFCMPCRRSRCSQCCRRKKSIHASDEAKRPVLSATSSATTTHLEVIDETQPGKSSCWQKLNCCKRCKKKPVASVDMTGAEPHISAVHEETKLESGSTAHSSGPAKQSKCGLCLSKVFCCRSVNKVEATSGVETEVKKCCFCIPCRRKKAATLGSASGSAAAGSVAWQDPEAGIAATDSSVLEGVEAVPKQGCCKRFWGKLLCCRKKPPVVPSDSRRQSIKAPAPIEDTRRKLHVDLVEYNSKMKGAIPVLPLYLAWFCALCNVVIPGLGTLFSGVFCLCLGIPRFSQYDSAKARIGAFIINIIVAVSQFCCVLFCCVGWGWSIWWGTIMLRCARKLKKIRKVERLEMEEEKRQADAAAVAAATAARVAHNAELETTVGATTTTTTATAEAAPANAAAVDKA